MDTKAFKNMFDRIAVDHGFKKLGALWFMESDEHIVTLDLQRSNYSKLYYLNIKVFIRGLFGRQCVASKELIKDTGDIFRREPKEYSAAFDLDNTLTEIKRKQEIIDLFLSFLNVYCRAMLTKKSIKEYAKANPDQICLLPAVRKELGFQT